MDRTPRRTRVATTPQQTPQNPSFTQMQELEERELRELRQDRTRRSARLLHIRAPIINRSTTNVARITAYVYIFILYYSDVVLEVPVVPIGILSEDTNEGTIKYKEAKEALFVMSKARRNLVAANNLVLITVFK